MIIDEVKQTVALTFDVPAEQLDEESSGRTIPEWDSVGHLNLVMALEERFKITFTVNEIIKMRDIQMIRRVLRDKLG